MLWPLESLESLWEMGVGQGPQSPTSVILVHRRAVPFPVLRALWNVYLADGKETECLICT